MFDIVISLIKKNKTVEKLKIIKFYVQKIASQFLFSFMFNEI